VVAASLAAGVLAAIMGLLAGPATPLVVGTTIVLGSALAFWQWPYASLLVLLSVRVAVPSFEMPNILFAVGGALGLILRAAPLPPKRVTVPLLAFLALALATVPLAPSEQVAEANRWLEVPVVDLPYFPRGLFEGREWLRVASIFVACWLAFSVARTPKDLGRVVAAVMVAAAACIGIALWQWSTGGGVEIQGVARIAGPFSHPSYFAYFLLLVIGVGLVSVLESRRLLTRGLAGAIVCGSVLCLFLTYSRAAWIGLLVVAAVLALLQYRWLLVALAVAVPLGLATLPQVTADVERRFADLSAESGASSVNSWNWRKDHWSRMRPYAFERPLVGHGFGSYHAVSVNEYGAKAETGGVPEDGGAGSESKDDIKGVNAHNDYLKALVETGVGGLTLWIMVLLGFASAAWSARRSPAVKGYATALFGLTLTLAGISAVDNLRDDVLVLVYFAAMLGAVLGVSHRTHNRSMLG
jgi:O-antigen ligase